MYEAAIAMANRALSARPGHLPWLLHAARVNVRNHDLDAAEGLYREALRKAPDDLRVLKELSRVLATAGKLHEARTLARHPVAG